MEVQKRRKQLPLIKCESRLKDLTFQLYSSRRRTFRVVDVNGALTFKITLSPGLKQEGRTFLTVTHNPSNRQDVNLQLFSTSLPYVLQQDLYYVFETHVVTDNGKCVYLSLQNVQTSYRKELVNVPIYRPIFNFGIAFWNPGRFTSLPFVLPDKLEGIETKKIPQHLPIYSKKAGDITSASVKRYLGYFIPDPNSRWESERKNAETWTLTTKADFSGSLGARVRFGDMKEQEIQAIYLNHFPGRSCKEIGYCPHPTHGKGWGASADALSVDKNGKKIALEFKASVVNCKFSGYMVGQLIWEMACLDVEQGEIIRYCEHKNNLNDGVTKSCRLLRVDRDRALEREIQALVEVTKEVERQKNTVKFKELIFGEKYKSMRDRLDRMAEKNIIQLEIPDQLLKEMNAYRQARCSVEIPSQHSFGSPFSDLVERAIEIEERYTDGENIQSLVEKQIEGYKAWKGGFI